MNYIYGKLKKIKIMKIEWNTIIAVVIALVVYKVLDNFVLDKALNKLEETI